MNDNKDPTAARRKKKKRNKPQISWSHLVHLPSKPSPSPSPKLDPEKYGTAKMPFFKGKPARVFHTLADYHRVAFSCLERRESLIFSAYPSVGRALLVEYAAAMAVRDNQKVLIICSTTSLCCRKYRDMRASFGSDGATSVELLVEEDPLLDVPSASCIISTPMVLEKLLFKEASLLENLGCVVFDEVLQGGEIDSPEFKASIELSLMLLEPRVQCAFLNFRIGNISQFAQWLASLKSHAFHIVSTEHTVLQKHYGYPYSSDGMFFLGDESGEFIPEKFNKMQVKLQEDPLDGLDIQDNVWWHGQGIAESLDEEAVGSVLTSVGNVLSDTQVSMQFMPCLVFLPSGQRAEECCMRLADSAEFTLPPEKEKLKALLHKALASLSPKDRNSNMVQGVESWLVKGIGVYHSGLLPVLREAVEIAVEFSLIKVLCATADYAQVGHVPFKTVMLACLYQSKNGKRCPPSPTDYTRMCALASIKSDVSNLVVVILKWKLRTENYKRIIGGKLQDLSGFTTILDSNLLNLLKKYKGIKSSAIGFLVKSFEVHVCKEKEEELREQCKALQAISSTEYANDFKDYLVYKGLVAQMVVLRKKLWDRALKPDVCLEFLQPGRVVRVGNKWGWGVLLSVDRCACPSMGTAYRVNMLLRCDKNSEAFPKPAQASAQDCIMLCVPMELDMVTSISKLRMCLPNTLGEAAARKAVLTGMQNLESRFPDGFPRLDIIQDMGLTDPEIVATVRELEAVCDKMHSSRMHGIVHDESKWTSLVGHFESPMKLQKLQTVVTAAASRSDLAADVGTQMDVYEKLLFCKDGLLTPKGLGACEIQAADSLLCAEVVHAGVFDNVDEEVATCAACVLLQVDAGHGESSYSLHNDTLTSVLGDIQQIADELLESRLACGQKVDSARFIRSLNCQFMYGVLSWLQGKSLDASCRFTGMYEGAFVTACWRLDHLMLELTSCARVMGKENSASTLEKGIHLLRRGVLLAPSLYLTNSSLTV